MDNIINHYEECFRKHGDTHKGVDWPNEQDAYIRYQVMLQGMPFSSGFINNRFTLLDYGCGLGHLYKFMHSRQIEDKVAYSGCDASLAMINHCKAKFPHNNFFKCEPNGIKNSFSAYDYIVCNGVFTEKRDYSFDEMLQHSTELIISLFSSCNEGIILNFMSANVDWQRDDLFHLPLDMISSFVSTNMSRHFIIRNDYALYEYTIYIYKNPFPNIFTNIFA